MTRDIEKQLAEARAEIERLKRENYDLETRVVHRGHALERLRAECDQAVGRAEVENKNWRAALRERDEARRERDALRATEGKRLHTPIVAGETIPKGASVNVCYLDNGTAWAGIVPTKDTRPDVAEPMDGADYRAAMGMPEAAVYKYDPATRSATKIDAPAPQPVRVYHIDNDPDRCCAIEDPSVRCPFWEKHVDGESCTDSRTDCPAHLTDDGRAW